MNTGSISIGMEHSTARVAAIRRLALAVVLSAGAHMLLAQLMPHLVKPYQNRVLFRNPALTVTLRPAADLRPKPPTPPLPKKPALGEVLGKDPLPHPEPDTLRELPSTEPTAAPALPLLDYFYTTREVDTAATAVGDALLVYPREALQLGVSGEVKLRLFIDETGALVRSEMVSADPPGIFEDAAGQAVTTMRFLPARIGDRPVRSQRTVLITFDPQPAHFYGSTTAR